MRNSRFPKNRVRGLTSSEFSFPTKLLQYLYLIIFIFILHTKGGWKPKARPRRLKRRFGSVAPVFRARGGYRARKPVQRDENREPGTTHVIVVLLDNNAPSGRSVGSAVYWAGFNGFISLHWAVRAGNRAVFWRFGSVGRNVRFRWVFDSARTLMKLVGSADGFRSRRGQPWVFVWIPGNQKPASRGLTENEGPRSTVGP